MEVVLALLWLLVMLLPLQTLTKTLVVPRWPFVTVQASQILLMSLLVLLRLCLLVLDRACLLPTILEVLLVERLTQSLTAILVVLALLDGQARVFFRMRMRLQVRVQESLDRLVCDMSESPLPNSDNSSMGVACVDPASAAVASLLLLSAHLLVHVFFCAAGAVHARVALCHPCMLHFHTNSWSDTVSLQGPRGSKRG